MTLSDISSGPPGLAGKLTSRGHELAVRVYFEDTDFTGVVYHARYLHYFERGRSDFLRCKEINHKTLEEGLFGEALFFIVKAISLDFSLPAHIDDILTVETVVLSTKGARLVMQQTIMRDEVLVASAEVTVVLVNGQGKPRRLPDGLIQALVN